MSGKEVCAVLGCGRTTLYRLRKKGDIAPRILGGRLGYLESEVKKFLKNLPLAP
ncbi:helix-turn-helix transcriptional regulator [Geomonas agri]|uniref:helix-turn-helix transcriptional regulator n=1 Tax=Geomonas agri TaxID=2873702 RepID=UPI001CD21F43